MYFYQVLAGSQKFHGTDALTYGSDIKLAVGMVVTMPLKNREVAGVVVEEVTKPKFSTKDITKVLTDVPLPDTSLQLMEWLKNYYPAPLGVITNQFFPAAILRQAKAKQAQEKPVKKPMPKLTDEQLSVLKTIRKYGGKTVLLHGDTGTGKTRIYIERAGDELKAGKSVLVLTPEIGLTPQLVRDFESAFGKAVIVVHSHLSDAGRRDAWLRILTSMEPVIVIGPRSALFAPFKNLGLIVVDEAHESAYKQEQAPYYQALRVASQLARIHEAQLVLGSATPLVSEYYIAKAKQVPIVRMHELATKSQSKKPLVTVVPGREKNLFTRHSYLSDELLGAIEDALKNHEQSLVFLNRRGTARLVMCQACSWQALCPVCDLPLTYHGDTHTMRCHTCGHKEQALSACPVCKSSDIIFRSIGTKALADSLQKLFPKAKVQRFDTDNKQDERIADHYDSLVSGDVQILVGTQILAKGLDLPKLSVVGVVAADTSLYLPDYTSEEKTYQMLSQVIGRVGRGHRPGKAIIQSYSPESPAIKAALLGDWSTFYNTQLKEREKYMFPPFCYLLKLTCKRKTQNGAISASSSLLKQLMSMNIRAQIIGPSPAFHEKTAGYYQWQLVVKAKDRSHLLEIVKNLPAGWSYDLDPTNLL